VKSRLYSPFWLHGINSDIINPDLRSFGITQRRVAILYRRFGTKYRSHLQGSWTSRALKIGPTRCPETTVKDYHSTLRNIPKERRCHQHRGGSLESNLHLDRRFRRRQNLLKYIHAKDDSGLERHKPFHYFGVRKCVSRIWLHVADGRA
jgi:hypothetical protein